MKTLDMSTRLSLGCCEQMAGRGTTSIPVGQLVSLIPRCNRFIPHKEVSVSVHRIDILLKS